MALYNQAPFTVDPHAPIPEDAAPAAIDELDPDGELQQASEAYAPDDKIAVTVTEPGPNYVQVELAPATEFQAGYTVHWEWGDGESETADDPGDLIQGHQYLRPGSYLIAATVRQDGLSSIGLSIEFASADQPPEPEPG